MNLNGIEHIYIAQHLVRVVTAHDKFAAIVGAEMLRRWRKKLTDWNQFSNEISPEKTKKSFPSPDLAYWDETNNWDIQCEFKPPKEEDRNDTIYTGIGQSVGYLHSSVNADITFLIAPKNLNNGFDVGGFLTTLFEEIIEGELPMGLILYNPEDPIDIEMACAPVLNLVGEKKTVLAKKKVVAKVGRRKIAVIKHELLESIVAAEMLKRWKGKYTKWNQFGPDIRPDKPKSSFPSPDFSFRDDTNGFDIQCTFKTTSESDKRDTVHTGIGKSMTHLHSTVNADVTFLIAPKYLNNGFDVGEHLTTFFEEIIEGKLPMGLILYNPEDPIDIEMACPPDLNLVSEKKTVLAKKKSTPKVVEKRARPGFHTVDRYWAKWCDMSTSELHYLLHSSHACKDMDKETRKNKIISSTWEWLIGDSPYLERRDPHVFWAPTMGETFGWKDKRLDDETPYPGKPIVKGDKKRSGFLRKVASGKLSRIDAEKQFSEYLNELGGNSPMYRVIYKNNFMTLDHLQLWDGSYFLNERGLELFEIGNKHGPNSAYFIDAFARMMLTFGQHFRLIKDLHEFTKGKDFKSSHEAINEFVIFYAGKNFIRFNQESKTEGKGGTKPMKYELLIWGKLDLLKKRSKHPQADVNGWVKGHGFLFNINRINQLMAIK